MNQGKVCVQWESVEALRNAWEAYSEKLRVDMKDGKLTRKEYTILMNLWMWPALNEVDITTGYLPTPEELSATLTSPGLRTIKAYYRELRKKGYIRLEGFTPEQVPLYTLATKE